MKEVVNNSSLQNKVEFWAATAIFVFSVLFLITGHEQTEFFGYSSHYRNWIFPNLVQAGLLYGAFLFLNFKVIPRLVDGEQVILNVLLLLLTFLAVWVVFGTSSTYLKVEMLYYMSEQDAYNQIFQSSFRHVFWLFLMLGVYSAIKYSSFYLLSNSEAIQSRYKLVTRDGLLAFVLWMVSMFLLLLVDAEGELLVGWGVVAPCGILLYCYSFYRLIPKALGKKRPFLSYAFQCLLWVVLLNFPMAILLMLFLRNSELAIGLSFFNLAFQMVITTPICWLLFKRHMEGHEEVQVLQKELGRSNANLDFLRSQINPHFLFNALNTLYGTALQENSERTAQGIQMLGDMMRFMLHENHQQKILLSREIEYMRNYIDLQLLRTSASPNITIQTKIEDVLDEKFIAPMLLIPFVENAFKHGISLKNPSWIKISLHCEQNKLYFDVYNSKQPKQERDTEKDASGIGLANVKQRLSLLYAGRHDLIIRDTPEEYFVHLTLTL
ncbi:sensor histidine kinase [Rufibacter immobilis]|uniref:sensor histidine kinase n=1 Tax=Rufibacter immobilis TaxID=1348778 RepID=UPI0035E81F79